MTGHGRPPAFDPDDAAAAPRIAAILGLAPLPEEGGLFLQAYLDTASSAIYFLLSGGDFSAMHILDGPETYHFYGGAPLRLLLVDEATGGISEPVLGMDLEAGQRPQLTVPAGVWQGSSSLGAWTLIGTTMAPPFAWESFRLGRRAELVTRFPSATRRLTQLTREP